MLFSLTPAKEVSGGQWYKDGELEEDRIDQKLMDVIKYLGSLRPSQVGRHTFCSIEGI